MSAMNVYELVQGLHIDITLADSEDELVPVSILLAAHYCVMRPGSAQEEIWPVSMIQPNTLRHTVPEDAELLPGKYKIQPYIETVDGYKGRCETVSFKLTRNFK